MKVLQIITKSEEGGAQNVCYETILGLKEKNIRFEVACFPGGWLQTECEKIGVKVHPLHFMCKEIKPLSDLRTLFTVIGIIRKAQFDLVHCHSSKAGLIGRLAAFLTRTPVIFTAHGWVFTAGASKTNRHVGLVSEFVASRLSDAIICVSQYDLELGLQYRMGSRGKLLCIRNGAPDCPSDLISTPAIVNKEVVIVMVARFSTQKNQAQLIQAAQKLKGDFQIQFVGEGSLLEESVALAQQLGLSDKVKFLGNRNDVAEVLTKAHIGVLTTHYEGLPISLIEMLRAGLPLVASDVGGVNELIADSVNGYLITRDNTEMLVDSLQTLIDMPAERESMGKESRKRFLKDYLVDQFILRTEDIYTRVIPHKKDDEGRVLERSNVVSK